MELVHVYIAAVAFTAIVLLALDKVPMSMVGIGMIIAMAAWPGLIDGRSAIQGFANPAVVTVAALFIVGEGFLRTGAASVLADKVLHRTGPDEPRLLLLIMVMAATLSAFVNNTLVVVTFMPVITSICRDTQVQPSRLLIPLSYASIVGGMCTLVGTSTNILVAGVLTDARERRPPLTDFELTMFEMAPAGIVLALTGMLYLALVGRRLLPRIPSLATQKGAAEIREFVTEVTVGPASPLIGTPVGEIGAVAGSQGTRPVMLVRTERLHVPPFGNMKVKEGDHLMISGGIQGLTALQRESSAAALAGDRYDPRTMTFFELAPTPNSSRAGMRIGDLRIKQAHGAVIAGLLRGGKHRRERFADLRLGHGDVLLAFGDDRSKDSLRNSNDFHLIEGIAEHVYNTHRAPLSLLILGAVVALFVTGAVDVPIAALLGAFAMVCTGCLNVRQAHRAVNWSVLAFIAGALALSKAADASGLNSLIGMAVSDGLGPYGPTVVLGGLFVSAILLTEILTNNAVAIILTPVALEIARAANLDARPLVMAVVFGASCCFANPIGYQTNLLVFGPGGYRFRDVLKVGLPMDLLLGVVGIATIPVFWPLRP